MNVVRTVDFMKPHVGLIFFVIGSCLILLLSIYYHHKSCYIKFAIDTNGKHDKNYNAKEDHNNT